MKSYKQHGFMLNTGAIIPAVGLGTWQAEGQACRDAVHAALQAGYRHFDCAHLYGNESEVGDALAEAFDAHAHAHAHSHTTTTSPASAEGGGGGGGGGANGTAVALSREDIFVTSKVILISTAAGAARRVQKAAEASLRRLRLRYLDLFLLHWVPPPSKRHVGDSTDPPRSAGGGVGTSPPKSTHNNNMNMNMNSSSQEAYLLLRLRDTWRAMEELLQRGLVRAIGVSNFDVPLLADLLSVATVVPAVNQVELHPLWRQEKLVRYCQERGIHVSAHTPLGLPGTTYEGQHEVLLSPRFSRSFSLHRPLLKNSAVGHVVEKLKKTPAQVVLRWAIQRGTSVLPRSLNPDRIRSNFDILDWSLSPQDWELINSMEPQLSLANDDIDHVFNNTDQIDSPTFIPIVSPLQSVDELIDGDDNTDETMPTL